MARRKKTLLTESTNRIPTIEQDGMTYMALNSNATMQDYENMIIQSSLNANSGHVVNAASQLDISKSKVYAMLKESDNGERGNTTSQGESNQTGTPNPNG